jgi:hypothetical protein
MVTGAKRLWKRVAPRETHGPRTKREDCDPARTRTEQLPSLPEQDSITRRREGDDSMAANAAPARILIKFHSIVTTR